MGYFKNVKVGGVRDGRFIKAPTNIVVSCLVMTKLVYTSIAEKCFDFRGILR